MLWNRSCFTFRLIWNNVRLQQNICRHKGDFSPLSSMFEKINLSDPLPQYRNITELKSADERVKKVLSMDYASKSECIDYLLHNFIDQISPNDSNCDQVEKLVALHLEIKQMQEDYDPEIKRHWRFSYKISQKKKERSLLLDGLRDHSFEVYAKVVSVLNIQHCFEPQYMVERTKLADEVEDMRIRSFAESRRLAAAKRERELRLKKLTEKYVHDISMTETSDQKN